MAARDGHTHCDAAVHAGFRDLVPRAVGVFEDDILSLAGPIFPAEAALVAHAVERRRKEFVAGRVLARSAFAGAGLAHAELPADGDGVPAWPPGFTGCITHACGRVALALASRASAESVGIDMEQVARFRRELECHLLSPTEIRRHLAATVDAERQARTAVLFCVKEAWFKCQFPLTRRRLGFLDAEIDVDWTSGRFAVLPGAGAPVAAGVSGCSSVQGGIARAAIVLGSGKLSAAARRAWRWPAVR